MKCLIVYMSHHGTTSKVVKKLIRELSNQQVFKVNLAHDELPPLKDYDTILIGGSIHVGNIQSRITDFMESNEKELLKKELGLFMCYMDRDRGQEEFETAFPEILREHAVAHGLFGGEFLFDQMNFFERLIVRKVSGSRESTSEIDEDAIHSFAERIKEAEAIYH